MSNRKRATPWVVIVTLLLALLLFTLKLDQAGLWQDEGLTLYQIRLPFPELLANRIPVAQFETQNTVPPLYFALMGLWGRLVGFDLWPLRLGSVALALLAVAALYPLGRTIAGPQGGRIITLLGALSPLYLWYAQELRMYGLLLLLSPLSLLLLWQTYLRLSGQRRAWPWAVAWLAVAAAMAWTHYLALLFIAAQALWLVVGGLRRYPRGLIVVLLMTVIALPLLRFAFARLQVGAERDFFFTPLPRLVNGLLQSLALGLPVFQSRVSSPSLLAILLLGLLSIGVWQAWRRGGIALASLLVATLCLPVALIYAISFVKPLYQNVRHLITIAPTFYLLVALALQRLYELRRWIPVALIAVWGVALVPSYTTYFDASRSRKNDVQPLFEYIASQVSPGDVVALNDPVLKHALDYFAPGLTVVTLPPYGYPTTPSEREAAYQAVVSTYPRLWYVYGPPDSSAMTWEEVLYWFNGRFFRLGYQEFPGQTEIGVVYYDLRGDTVQENPFPLSEAHPATVGGVLDLLGLSQPLPRSEAGHRTLVETVWTVASQPTESFSFRLSLLDGAGRLWAQSQSLPFDGLHPTDHWLPGQYVRLPLFLPLPVTLPPAEYRVQVELIGSDGRLVEVDDHTTAIPLGQMTVTRAQRPPTVEGTQVGGVVLAPQQLPQTPLPLAATLSVPLAARVTDPSTLPDTLELSVVDQSGSVVQSYTVPFLAGLPAGPDGALQTPSGGWQRNDTVLLRYEVALPPTLMGRFSLDLRALRGGVALPIQRFGGLLRRDNLALGTAQVAERAVSRDLPPVAQRVDITWPGVTTARGYSAEPDPVVAGQSVDLTLVWQAIAATDRPYKIFLHLVDAQGNQVDGADVYPAVPTTAWQAGEVVTSVHTLALKGVAAGRYTISVGLYDEADGSRLPIQGQGDAATLGTLEVISP